MRGLLTSAYQSLKIQIKNSTLNGQKKLLLVKQTLILWEVIYRVDSAIQPLNINRISTLFFMTSGADPGFFLGGGALVSCSTSTPINHIVFFYCFFAEYQLY